MTKSLFNPQPSGDYRDSTSPQHTATTCGSVNRRRFLAGASATGALALLHPFSARASASQAHLRVMETTDVHVHVYPYDYYADRENDTVGLARAASIIDAIRVESSNAMLVDNGDFLQGNPMGDYMAYERGLAEGDVHPIIAAMNVLGYDAATLGNHEFNYGLDFLLKSIGGAEFPVVCANVTKGKLAADATADDHFFRPYVILDRVVTLGDGSTRPIRIGLIGFVPPQIMTWDARHLEGRVNTRDIVDSARALVPEVREAGADIVIALSHSGIGSARHESGMENASVPLARIDGIDAVMTGHSHRVFPGPDYEGFDAIDFSAGTLHGKPAVMGGFWGSHLGLVDLLLEHEAGAWRIVDFITEARPIYERVERDVTALVESDQSVLDAARDMHDATLAYVRTPVGKTSAPLHSYFALVADDPSVQIVSQAQTWYVTDMLSDTEWADLPVLSAAAPFKAGGRGGPDYFTEVPAGDIAIKNVADLYLYPNTVRALVLTGADIKEWLEMSAGLFNTVEPGSTDTPLISDSFPSYNFDVIDGVTYEIDVSRPARYSSEGELQNPESNRILNLSRDGKPLEPDARFVVATNNYRAAGGGNFPGISEDKIVLEAPDTNRDVIVRYIIEQGTINPSADSNWRLASLEGTTVLFDTGPRGANYIDSVSAISIEEAGDGVDGFARYRIAL